MLDQIILHLNWMTKVLKDQHDSHQIGGGYSAELTAAVELLRQLDKFKGGGLITKRTRGDLSLLAGMLMAHLQMNVAGLGKALIEDLREDGIELDT